eukprot:c41684_g1_i1 orf=3-182(-)
MTPPTSKRLRTLEQCATNAKLFSCFVERYKSNLKLMQVQSEALCLPYHLCNLHFSRVLNS